MHLDRILYRLLTGSWGRFAFTPGPAALGNEPVPDPVGIYVHIPFCRSICPFCPYNKVLYDPELAERYSQCLLSEARPSCLALAASGSPVSTLAEARP